MKPGAAPGPAGPSRPPRTRSEASGPSHNLPPRFPERLVGRHGRGAVSPQRTPCAPAPLRPNELERTFDIVKADPDSLVASNPVPSASFR